MAWRNYRPAYKGTGARASKYGAQKKQYNGMTFDSARELRRWQELELMQRGGMIADLQRQVKFVLIPAQREPDTIGKRGGVHKGKLIEKEVAYYADFVYTENGAQVVEDAKGMRTPEYVIKRKLMLYMHGIRVREV